MSGNLDIRSIKVANSNEPWIIREKLLETGWITKGFNSADYWFFTHAYKKVGIERKSVSDMINSISGRLANQLSRMTEYYDFNILLLEGNWRMLNDKVFTHRGIEQWGWSTVWNFIRTWQDKGITLEITVNEGHTIKRLNELYTYYQKPGHSGGLNKKSVGDNRLLALQCGGIGIKKGEKLLEYFGTLKNIVNAEIQDYMQVDGIGKARAEALWNHFNRENN